MNTVIREMTDNDLSSVLAIYSESLTEGKATFQTECPTAEEWSARHCRDCRFVAVADGETVGWYAISPTSARDVYKGVVEVSVYISSMYRHSGLGEKLMKKLISETEKHGYWCLYSAVFACNTASIQLHEKCGFRRIGYREKIACDKFGIWRDTVLFERRSKIV